MQASQKAAMDEGFSRTRGNLQDLSEKMDDMERLFEEKIQGIPQVRIAQESEKIHDLTHEVKDFRREFDRFRGETMEKLDSVEKSMFDAKHSIEQSVSDIKETLKEISKSLPTSPISSPGKSVSHVHLSSHHHIHDQSFTLIKFLHVQHVVTQLQVLEKKWVPSMTLYVLSDLTFLQTCLEVVHHDFLVEFQIVYFLYLTI
jgi:chromosome segregation ATPase